MRVESKIGRPDFMDAPEHLWAFCFSLTIEMDIITVCLVNVVSKQKTRFLFISYLETMPACLQAWSWIHDHASNLYLSFPSLSFFFLGLRLAQCLNLIHNPHGRWPGHPLVLQCWDHTPVSLMFLFLRVCWVQANRTSQCSALKALLQC